MQPHSRSQLDKSRWRCSASIAFSVSAGDDALSTTRSDAGGKSAWNDLKADDGWLTVSGLFWLQPGETTIGSDPGNDVLLPARTPGSLGTLDARGRQGRLSAGPRCNDHPQRHAVRWRRDSLGRGRASGYPRRRRREADPAQARQAPGSADQGQPEPAAHELRRAALVSAPRRTGGSRPGSSPIPRQPS